MKSPIDSHRDQRVITKYATADQVVNNSVVLVDSALELSIGANETVYFWGYIRHASDAAADTDLAIAVPVGATGGWQDSANTVLSTTSETAFAGQVTLTGGGVAVVRGTLFSGVCINGATAGDITLQFAQNVAQANDCTLFAGSWIAGLRYS